MVRSKNARLSTGYGATFARKLLASYGGGSRGRVRQATPHQGAQGLAD